MPTICCVEYPAKSQKIAEIIMNTAVLDHVKSNDSPRSHGTLTEQQLLAMPQSDYMSPE